MFQFDTIPSCKFLYVITNHAVGAVKAMIRAVNMKLTKTIRANARMLEIYSMDACRVEFENKSFVAKCKGDYSATWNNTKLVH